MRPLSRAHRPIRLRALAFLFALGLAPGLVSFTQQASAQEETREYIIEIVLFEHATAGAGNALGGELWVPVTTGAINLSSEAARAEGFEPVEQLPALSDDATALGKSRRYRVLRHFAWRQPGLAQGATIPIRIALGETIPVYLQNDSDEGATFFRATMMPTPDSSLDASTTTLNGTLEVRLGRFLHLEANLVFTDVVQERSYKLQESRKMRSRELHYLDNQRFGLLARIIPVEATGS